MVPAVAFPAQCLDQRLRRGRGRGRLGFALELLFLLLLALGSVQRIDCIGPVDFSLRQCEPIRIDMCRGIGYNETSMPNLVGHELQPEVASTLQTFTPLIECVCSTQLKLFLCAAYVPMCTPKVPVPIGPCRSLCESVRSRCLPLLQGFGFPWPPALDCGRFPKENNHETMCMEGPGEAHSPVHENEVYAGNTAVKMPPQQLPSLDCPGLSKSHLYVKLHRSGRCAPLCEADILFGQYEKHLADVWVATWTYAALGLALVATLCLILSDDSKLSSGWSSMLTPLVWCHNMVAVGWTVRFVSGRTNTACGYDPQLPNISLLLVDGLSNASCAATFLLRYYFGMASCAWWAILCLGWHRDVRRNSPDLHGHLALRAAYDIPPHSSKQRSRTATTAAGGRSERNVTHSNIARFAAWGLPAFQTAAVIVARLVDADELLGACFVGNQSDKGLQILVATPLFCYWIFGSMNLISGYLVHRRKREFLHQAQNLQLQPQHQPVQLKAVGNSGVGTFLFIYCIPCALLLLAVIYEFANIDIWLNVPPYVTATEGISTPLWPFLTRAFMELMLGIICSAWVLGPKISTMYKRQWTPRPTKLPPAQCGQALHGAAIAPQSNSHKHTYAPTQNSRSSNVAYSTVSYQSVRHPITTATSTPGVAHHSPHRSATVPGTISMNQMSNYSLARSSSKCPPLTRLNLMQASHYKRAPHFDRYGGKETIL